MAITISVVVPVLNEENTLLKLYQRISNTLESLKTEFEIIFVNDGSTDNSAKILRQISLNDKRIKVIELGANYGQHFAIFKGLSCAKGKIIVSIDADLQNPPEEIPALIQKIEAGYDMVAGWRKQRKDSPLRKVLSYIANILASAWTGIRMHDYGCSLRAYSRQVVDKILKKRNPYAHVYIQSALVASNIAEIKVTHFPRHSGKSRYNLNQIIRLILSVLMTR
jgi:glycosyltransferase involved in cell wall biosynthesis